MSTTDTRQLIVNAARATVQAHGYNALSFRDLAKEVGVKSASRMRANPDMSAALEATR